MGDPHGAAAQICQSLKSNGSWMIVEPFSSDKPRENHNLIGRIFYGVSATPCVPCSIAGNGPGLGAQTRPTRIGVVKSGGFTKFRVATQTPMNIIYEANP